MTVKKRISKIFEQVKNKKKYRLIFDANDEIKLSPRSLAYIVSELQKYSLLNTNIDIKGKAYLKSKVGNRILLTNSYGAVITHIEPEHLATVPIPDAPDTLKLKIGNLVIRSYALRDESNNLIDEATKLLIDELHLPAIDDFSVNYFKKMPR